MSGKGSGARPFSVDRKTFAENFDAIFGKPKPAPVESIYCPKCGYDWIEHDASLPEPNCPRKSLKDAT